MSITYTQETPSVNSIKTVPIHPSLYEGAYGLTSILGHKIQTRGLRLVRYAPILKVAPIISGPTAIDEPTSSTLTCWAGVVDSSPTAKVTYQWRLDGVDIPGETSSTLLTLDSMDNKTVTCFVRHENNQGFIETESNGIILSLIEEIIINEAEWYQVTGQSGYANQNIMNIDTMLIQGKNTEGAITGFGLDTLAIQGLSPKDGIASFDSTMYGITGMNQDTHQNVYDVDIYMTRFFTLLEYMNLLNPGAENGILDWTATEGVMESVSSQSGGVVPFLGSKFFYGGDAQTNVKSYQDVTIPVGRVADVDAGIVFVGLNWVQNSYNETDEVYLFIDYLDNANTVISTETMYGSLVPTAKEWITMNPGLFLIPALTRNIRVHLEFTRLSGSGNLNGYVDDISLSLYSVT